MSERDDYGDLQFFGAIVASVSHELNNVITIIDQVDGLLQDLLTAEQSGAPITMGQLKTIHERIARQTVRGVEIVKNLNRFAHGIDEPSVLELNSVLENLFELARRIVERRRFKLVVQYANPEVVVTASQFWLQQLVFQCLQQFLNSSPETSEISVAVSREGSSAVVAMAGPEIAFVEPAGKRTASVRAEVSCGRTRVDIVLPLFGQEGDQA